MAKEKKKDKDPKKEDAKGKKATKSKRAKSKTPEEVEQVETLDETVKAKEGEIVEKTPAEKAEEEAEKKAEELKEEKEPSEEEAKVSEEEAQAPEEEEEEEELEIVEEKFYNLNLRKIWSSPREKRTPRAVRFLREYVSRHMKTDEVAISEEANSMLWQRGISKPPRKIRVRAVKDKDGRVIVFPGEVK